MDTTLRGSDILGRFGGDEFMAFLPNVDGRQAQRAIARIRERLRNSPQIGPLIERYGLAISAGVALVPGHGEQLAALFDHADAALLRAKAQGKNRTLVAPEFATESPSA